MKKIAIGLVLIVLGTTSAVFADPPPPRWQNERHEFRCPGCPPIGYQKFSVPVDYDHGNPQGNIPVGPVCPTGCGTGPSIGGYFGPGSSGNINIGLGLAAKWAPFVEYCINSAACPDGGFLGYGFEDPGYLPYLRIPNANATGAVCLYNDAQRVLCLL